MRGSDRIAGFVRRPHGGKAKTAETADAKTAKKAVPEYTVVDNAQVDLASFPQDKDGTT